MTITELVAKLEEIRATNGDLPVHLLDSDWSAVECEIESVQVCEELGVTFAMVSPYS
jgi:hypothetical protein